MGNTILFLALAALAARLITTQRVSALCWASVLGALLAAGLALANPIATLGASVLFAGFAAAWVAAIEQADEATRVHRIEAGRRHAATVGAWIAQSVIAAVVAILVARAATGW